MCDEVLIEGRFVEPTLVKIGEEFDFYMEARNPVISLCHSKKKHMKHLHDNFYSLCGEITKIRTGGRRFSVGVDAQMIVDCSQPVLITLNFGGGFKNSPDVMNYNKIPVWLKIPYRVFRKIYYFLVDVYKIGGDRSFPIFVPDNGKVRLKFLKEGDYIETLCKLFSYLDGGWEENLVEQKIAGVVSSVEPPNIEKIGKDYFIDHTALIKLNIQDIKDIEYVELGDFLDMLEWAVVVTLVSIFGLFLIIVSWTAYVILFPFIILRWSWHRYAKNNSMDGKNDLKSSVGLIKKNPLDEIAGNIAYYLTKFWLKIVMETWAILEKIKERLTKKYSSDSPKIKK